jgi:Flp pilus assembly protein TadG
MKNTPLIATEPMPHRHQRGSVAMFFMGFLIPLLGVGALAIDYGYILMERSELQNAADAAASAGASALYPYTLSSYQGPNFPIASTAANAAVKHTVVGQTAITSATVQTLYYNLNTGATSAITAAPTTYQVPAVQVTVSVGTNSNGGPIKMMLANLFSPGISMNLSATAIAVVSPPQTIPAQAASSPNTGVYPVVLDQTYLTNNLWDFNTNAPKIDASTGLPIRVSVGAIAVPPLDLLCQLVCPILYALFPFLPPNNYAGQTTSFTDATGGNQASLTALETTRNTMPLSATTPMQTGTTIYLPTQSFALAAQNLDVIVPVAPLTLAATVQQSTVISGFAAFHIVSYASQQTTFVFPNNLLSSVLLALFILTTPPQYILSCPPNTCVIVTTATFMQGYLSPTGIKAPPGSYGWGKGYGVHDAVQRVQ